MKTLANRTLIVAMLTAVWLAGCVAAMLSSFEAMRREAVEDLRVLSQLVMRNFDQTVQSVEYYMDDIDGHLAEMLEEESRHKLLTTLRLPRGMIQSTLVGLDGVVLASSRVFPTPRTSLIDREHIIVHMRNQVPALFVSTPVTGRISGQRTIQFSAFLPKSRNILVLSYDLADFKAAYVGIRPDREDKAVLIGLDGKIRAGSLRSTQNGKSGIGSEALLQIVRGGERGELDIGGTWSRDRNVGYFRRDATGMYALAMTWDADTLAEQTAVAVLPILAAWTLVIAVLGTAYRSLLIRQLQRLADKDKERRFRLLQSLMTLPDFQLVDPLRLDKLTATETESFRRVSVQDCEGRFVTDRWTTPAGPQERLWLKIPGEDLWVAVDMTQRIVEEDRAIRLARLAALGDMASGLAHEISQPLNVIRLASQNAKLLIEKAADPKAVAQKLDRIDAQAQRAGEICQRMRIYGQRRPLPAVEFRIDTQIEEACGLMAEMAQRAGVALEVGPLPPLTTGRINPAAFEQILMAVIRNAIEAAAEGFAEHSAPPQVRIGLSASDDGWAVVTVTDNGPGIADEIKPRIWEPFFTTRRGAKNAGLGFSVVYGWMIEAGGTVRIQDAKPGTIIELRLPSPLPADAAQGPQSGHRD